MPGTVEKKLADLRAQIEATPAHHGVPLRIRPFDHDLFEFRHLRVSQNWRAPWAGAGPQSRHALVIVAMDPVSQRLPGHRVHLRRGRARVALQQKRDRQKTANRRGVPDFRRRRAKFGGGQLGSRDFDRLAHDAFSRAKRIVTHRIDVRLIREAP